MWVAKSIIDDTMQFWENDWVDAGTTSVTTENINGFDAHADYFYDLNSGTGDLYLDDLTLEIPDVITTLIKNALVADLQLINGAGIFQTTVAEIGLEPKRYDEAKSPGIYIGSSAGEGDQDSITSRIGTRSQDYNLDLIIKGSNTPNADLDTFLDDIANAIEHEDSNINGVNGVESVVLSEWTAVHTDPGISEGIYLRRVTVSVTYLYSRGSA